MNRSKSRATLADVARHADVAKSTASLVFSAPTRVAPETVQRVLTAAKLLDYRPNPLAQGLKNRRGSMIGMLVNDMRNPLSGLAQTVAQRTAHEAQQMILTSTSEGDVENELEILSQFNRINIRGVVLTSAGKGEAHCARLRETGLHFVTLDLRLPELGCDHVGIDNRAATEGLTRHLIEKGHRRIAHISGGGTMSTSIGRRQGVEDALRAAGLPVEPLYMKDASFSGDTAAALTRELMELDTPPTAIVAANAPICAGVLRALDGLGLSCPEDLSVVTVDDPPWRELVKPRITCVTQPFDTMARAAVERILALQHGGWVRRSPPLVQEYQASFLAGDSVRDLS